MEPQIKSLSERYCRIVGRNVTVETTRSGKNISCCCLNTPKCGEARGECSGQFLHDERD